MMMIKPRWMRQVGHIACMGGRIIKYRFLQENLNERDHGEKPGQGWWG
jgi:hypothetical protein